MTETPTIILSGWIKDSFKSIRVADAKIIREIDPVKLARYTAEGLRSSILFYKDMTEMAKRIGHSVLNGSGRDLSNGNLHKLEAKAFKIGWHLIHVAAKHGIIKVERVSGGKEKKTYEPYKIYGKDKEFLKLLFSELDDVKEGSVRTHVEVLLEEPAPWTGFWNQECGPLIRNASPNAHKYFKPSECELVFATINKLSSNRYGVNADLLEVFEEMQDDSSFTFSDKNLDDIQLSSKLGEYERVLKIARGIGEQAFYQHMFYDWRGRIYSHVSYFNPSGNKLAKSLIQFKKKTKIGMNGYFWLLVHTANCFGHDKDTIDGRHDFTEKHLKEWLKWAKNPQEKNLEVLNKKTGELEMRPAWTQVDSPFEFLAAIMEIAKSHAHKGGPYEYESGLMVAFDATCSGLQIFGALARDRHSAELSNIADVLQRGDYYKMIADHVWKNTEYTPEEGVEFEELMELYSDKKFDDLDWKKMYSLSNVFWGRPEISGLRRKICKRSCMTYFYSCGPEKMAESIIEDFGPDPEFAGLNMTNARWLTSHIYRACQKLMEKPTELMKLFVAMGISDYKKKKDFHLKAPFTGFTMIQHYRDSTVKQIAVKYLGKTIKPRVFVGTNDKFDLKRIKSGSAPNVVHMLDGVLMSAIVLMADYEVSCVHDSFAASIGDAWKLFEDTRMAFVDIFGPDVLQFLLDQKLMDNNVEYGDLKIKEVIENEQCFS